MQNRHNNVAQAQDYYQRCIVFCETAGHTEGGYYLFANHNLAQLAVSAHDERAAKRYYQVVLKISEHRSPEHKEAADYLRTHAKG